MKEKKSCNSSLKIRFPEEFRKLFKLTQKLRIHVDPHDGSTRLNQAPAAWWSCLPPPHSNLSMWSRLERASSFFIPVRPVKLCCGWARNFLLIDSISVSFKKESSGHLKEDRLQNPRRERYSALAGRMVVSVKSLQHLRYLHVSSLRRTKYRKEPRSNHSSHSLCLLVDELTEWEVEIVEDDRFLSSVVCRSPVNLQHLLLLLLLLPQLFLIIITLSI